VASFDPKKHATRFAEAGKRSKIAKAFQEPDRMPVSISVGGSFHAWRLGVNIKDYYLDPEIQFDVQVDGMQWVAEELGDDRTSVGISVDIGPIAEGIYFDTDIIRPDDTSPWVPHVIETPEQVLNLKLPDPEDHKGVLEIYKRYEQLKVRAEKIWKGEVSVGGGMGFHPPLSAACAVVPLDTLYAWLVEEPTLVRMFFAKMLTAFLKLQDFKDRYFGQKTTHMGLADDNSAFVSNETYRQFVMPYNMTIYERYGSEWRYLHADGPNDHHFAMYANDMRLNEMDMGGFSDIANAKRDLGGKTAFHGGLNCKDLYYDFETAKPVVDRAIRIGAPGGGFSLNIGGEAYAGVNPQTLVKVVDYAKKAGRYPIDIEALQ